MSPVERELVDATHYPDEIILQNLEDVIDGYGIPFLTFSGLYIHSVENERRMASESMLKKVMGDLFPFRDSDYTDYLIGKDEIEALLWLFDTAWNAGDFNLIGAYSGEGYDYYVDEILEQVRSLCDGLEPEEVDGVASEYISFPTRGRRIADEIGVPRTALILMKLAQSISARQMD